MQLNLNNFSEIERIKEDMKDNFENIKSELDEHLDSINQNSIEVQSNYDYLEELNNKIEKLEEKIDNVCFLVNNIAQNNTSKNIESADLDKIEKEVFLVLYTSNQPLSFEEIALRSSLPVHKVEDCIEKLVFNRYPILKKRFAEKDFLYLDENYKDKNISKKLTH